jgi:cytochrome bd-type quinol oxidase subunit 1
MSLRAFHIIFVIVTVALSLGIAVWGVQTYRDERSMTGLAMAVIFFATAAVGVVYGQKVYRKLKVLP